MSINEYADAAHANAANDHRQRDNMGRLLPETMTDREIAEETLSTLRQMSDQLGELAVQVGPSLQTMMNGPLARLLGAGK